MHRGENQRQTRGIGIKTQIGRPGGNFHLQRPQGGTLTRLARIRNLPPGQGKNPPMVRQRTPGRIPRSRPGRTGRRGTTRRAPNPPTLHRPINEGGGHGIALCGRGCALHRDRGGWHFCSARGQPADGGIWGCRRRGRHPGGPHPLQRACDGEIAGVRKRLRHPGRGQPGRHGEVSQVLHAGAGGLHFRVCDPRRWGVGAPNRLHQRGKAPPGAATVGVGGVGVGRQVGVPGNIAA